MWRMWRRTRHSLLTYLFRSRRNNILQIQKMQIVVHVLGIVLYLDEKCIHNVFYRIYRTFHYNFARNIQTRNPKLFTCAQREYGKKSGKWEFMPHIE